MEIKTGPSGVTQGHSFPWYLRFHTWAVKSCYSEEFCAAYISYCGSSQVYPAVHSLAFLMAQAAAMPGVSAQTQRP